MEINEPSPFTQNGSTSTVEDYRISTRESPIETDLLETNDECAEDEQEEDDIAFAAEAAANAVEEADAEQQRLDQALWRCRICSLGVAEGRPLLRFLPMDPVLASLTTQALSQNLTSVPTFSEEIFLHVFCGKTASILPSVNQPELEILNTAGIKNKHGIGVEVNAALARTRCAVLVSDGTTIGNGTSTTSTATLSADVHTTTTARATNKQEKSYFLVREFEAHLAAIRSTYIAFNNEAVATARVMQFPSHTHVRTLTHPKTPVVSTLYSSDERGTTREKISYRDVATTTFTSAYPSASNGTPTTTGPASPMLPLLTSSNGPLSQTLTSRQVPDEKISLSASQAGCVHPAVGGLPLLTVKNDMYPNQSADIPFMQMTGQWGQDPIQTSIDTSPLPPPPLPQGQDLPMNGRMTPPHNSHLQPLLKSSSNADIIGLVGNNELPYTSTRSKSKGSPPKRAGAGKRGVKLAKTNEVHGALLPAPSLSKPEISASDEKVQCDCGGKYLNAISSSWRNHVNTKRHQRWMESQVIQRPHHLNF